MRVRRGSAMCRSMHSPPGQRRCPTTRRAPGLPPTASRHWAAYVAGALVVLARERGMALTTGARVLVESDVPEGKGVSSSAALEAAVMQALRRIARLDVPPRDMALLCQKVENLVVGAPCGVMDQMTAIRGEAGRLLALLCQPAEFEGAVPLPGAARGVGHRFRHPPRGDRRGLRLRPRRGVHGLPHARGSGWAAGASGRTATATCASRIHGGTATSRTCRPRSSTIWSPGSRTACRAPSSSRATAARPIA